MSLGLIDTSDRKVRPSSELGRLVNFGNLKNTDPIVIKDGDVPATVEYMKTIVREHHTEVSKIADKLYDEKLSRFLKNIFDFVMTYVKYEKDSAFKEQLRTPLRTLSDQRGDCDCMSILIGSILYNKKIPFCFRVTKYSETSDFSHVYVVVPRDRSMNTGRNGSYYVVDPVIREFDKEKEFVAFRDFVVDPRLNGLDGLPIQMLNGTTSYMSGIELAGGLYGLYGDIMAVTLGTDLFGYGLGSDEDDEMAMYNYLVRTRDVILTAPGMFKIMKNPLEVARMLDYAIRYWNTPLRDNALDVLEIEEKRLISDGVIVYPHADLSGDEIGELGLGVFKKVKNTVKKATSAVAKGVAKGTTVAAKTVAKGATVAAKGVAKGATVAAKTVAKGATVAAKGVAKGATVAAKGVAKGAKATGKAIAKGAKATGKAIVKGAKATANFVVRYNPVSLAARGGMLMAIRNNMWRLADKLQWGLYTETQAQEAGLNMNDFRENQEAYKKSEKTFCGTLRGKKDKFQKAISQGVKNRAINGLGEVTTAAMVVSALGFITTVLSFFVGKRNPKTGEEYPEEYPSERDLEELMGYDEDGNPINSTTGGKQNFLQRTTGLIKNAANKFLPSGSSQVDDDYDDYGYDMQNNTALPPSPSAPPPKSFLEKNALLIGVGVAGLAGAIYLITRKKKK